MNNYIIIDIETSAKPESELSFPEFEPSKVLKDPEKIKTDIENKRKAFIDESALHAERGFVVAIGLLQHGDEPIILEGDEKKILENFWHYLMLDRTIVGHCIRNFDIPYLMRRSWLQGVPFQKGIMEGRYLNNRFKDTMETWQCGGRDMISLDNLSKAFGLEGKKGKGSEFAALYAEGGASREKALDYLRNDLALTQAVAQKMGLI